MNPQVSDQILAITTKAETDEIVRNLLSIYDCLSILYDNFNKIDYAITNQKTALAQLAKYAESDQSLPSR